MPKLPSPPVLGMIHELFVTAAAACRRSTDECCCWDTKRAACVPKARIMVLVFLQPNTCTLVTSHLQAHARVCMANNHPTAKRFAYHPCTHPACTQSPRSLNMDTRVAADAARGDCPVAQQHPCTRASTHSRCQQPSGNLSMNTARMTHHMHLPVNCVAC